MKQVRRLEDDDVCNIACPSGPPPTCPKKACQRAVMMFEPPKNKPTKPRKGKAK